MFNAEHADGMKPPYPKRDRPLGLEKVGGGCGQEITPATHTAGLCKLFDNANLERLGALLALRYFKLDPGALLKRPVPLGQNFGMVNKNVLTVIRVQETKTFCVVEPLYGPFGHY